LFGVVRRAQRGVDVGYPFFVMTVLLCRFRRPIWILGMNGEEETYLFDWALKLRAPFRAGSGGHFRGAINFA
jgi:hypothetical protein